LPTFIWAFEKLEVPQIAKWPEKVGKSPSLEGKSGQMWHHCGTSKRPKIGRKSGKNGIFWPLLNIFGRKGATNSASLPTCPLLFSNSIKN